MSVPTFAGLPVFGRNIRMVTKARERPASPEQDFGRDGNASRDGGGRGYRTIVTGEHVGRGAYGLAQAQNWLRMTNDGEIYSLLDVLGQLWPSVGFESFEPKGRARQNDQGWWSQDYSATFLHLE